MATQAPAPPVASIERLLAQRGPPTYAVNPAPTLLGALVEALDEASSDGPDADGGEAPATRLLVETEAFKDQVEDFLFASSLADLTDRDAVAVRTADGFLNGNLLLYPGTAVQVFDLEVRLAAVGTDEADVVAALERQASTRWEAGTAYSLRTPARTAIADTLADQLGPDAEADFSAIVDSLETARGKGRGLDEVTIALLVAAKNEALLYDISKWGEDVGLASKATFSRTKSTLEKLGLIATEKVPIDVGRPRLRLKFADDRLQGATADELASVAMGLME